MDEERRQESKGWSKRQRARLLQRCEPGETGVESPAAGRRSKEKVVLFQNGRDEKETYFSQNREGSEQPDK
jgi:hypothetical protein